MTVGDSSDERALATMLAASADAELTELFAARRLPLPNPAHDFFDVAAALLAENMVDRALTRLPADLLAALSGDATPAQTAALAALALVDADGRPFDVVTARLRTLRAGAAVAAPAHAPAPVPADDRATAAAGERAFSAVYSLSDVLVAARSAPLPRTGAGAVSVAERRRLIEDGAVADPEELDDLVALAADADLLEGIDRSWRTTVETTAWLGQTTSIRWSIVAHGFVSRLPAGLRLPGGGFLPSEGWAGAYPLDSEWPARAAVLARRARRWGILAEPGVEPAWTTGLRTTGVPDLDALGTRLPPEVDRIYLQADLTAISPGPLAPRAEQRLRSMAVRETRAQASTYRFTTESLTAAVSAGESAQSLRSFLSELSLTGIPQPLDYLIETTASRHGLVRVSSDGETGRTVVRSSDPQVLATIAVDQALRPVGLIPHEGALVSRAPRDAVYWSLIDARYPVVAVDGDDEVERLSRRAANVTTPEADAAEQYARLVEALRATHGADADAAWLERELEQAVRARSVIEVEVSLPNGTSRTFLLEATGIGGGRLRGLDRGADVERTLPLSSIASVRHP